MTPTDYSIPFTLAAVASIMAIAEAEAEAASNETSTADRFAGYLAAANTAVDAAEAVDWSGSIPADLASHLTAVCCEAAADYRGRAEECD